MFILFAVIAFYSFDECLKEPWVAICDKTQDISLVLRYGCCNFHYEILGC